MKYHKNLIPQIEPLKGTAIRRTNWHVADQKRYTKSYPIEIARLKTAQGTVMFSFCLMNDFIIFDDSPVFQASKYPDTVMEFSL